MTQWNYRLLLCGWSIIMFQWYFTVNLFFEPMIVQVQDFFKDVNAQNAMFWTLDSLCYKWKPFWVLCLEFWKMTSRSHKNSSKVIVKNCKLNQQYFFYSEDKMKWGDGVAFTVNAIPKLYFTTGLYSIILILPFPWKQMWQPFTFRFSYFIIKMQFVSKHILVSCLFDFNLAGE